jgi:hypothetical protein
LPEPPNLLLGVGTILAGLTLLAASVVLLVF